MKYLVFVFALFNFDSFACSQGCTALGVISFDDDNQTYLYGELKSEMIEMNPDIRLPVPKIEDVNFIIDDDNNSAISFVKGGNVKKISVIEVTSQKTKKFLGQLFSIIQSQNISELDCTQLSELIEVSGDINNKLGVKVSIVEYIGSKVLKLFGKSTFESPLLISSYIFSQQGRFFIVDVYSETGLAKRNKRGQSQFK